jgi:hypothetical protein
LAASWRFGEGRTAVRDKLVGEARAILSSAGPGGDRRELAWAAGVWACGHALHLVSYWLGDAGPRALAWSPHWGSSLDRGRWILATHRRIEVYGGDLDRPLIVGWPDVAALIDTARTQHVDACRAALAERGEFLRQHSFTAAWGSGRRLSTAATPPAPPRGPRAAPPPASLTCST